MDVLQWCALAASDRLRSPGEMTDVELQAELRVVRYLVRRSPANNAAEAAEVRLQALEYELSHRQLQSVG